MAVVLAAAAWSAKAAIGMVPSTRAICRNSDLRMENEPVMGKESAGRFCPLPHLRVHGGKIGYRFFDEFFPTAAFHFVTPRRQRRARGRVRARPVHAAAFADRR